MKAVQKVKKKHQLKALKGVQNPKYQGMRKVKAITNPKNSIVLKRY